MHACGCTGEGIWADGRPGLLGEWAPCRVGVTPMRSPNLDGRVLAPDPRLLSTTAATPAAAGRGKGGPKAHPAGTRSALPATNAAGTLRCGRGAAGAGHRPVPEAVATARVLTGCVRRVSGALLSGQRFPWIFHGLARRSLPGDVPLEPVVAGEREDGSGGGAPSGTRTPNPLIKSRNFGPILAHSEPRVVAAQGAVVRR